MFGLGYTIEYRRYFPDGTSEWDQDYYDTLAEAMYHFPIRYKGEANKKMAGPMLTNTQPIIWLESTKEDKDEKPATYQGRTGV